MNNTPDTIVDPKDSVASAEVDNVNGQRDQSPEAAKSSTSRLTSPVEDDDLVSVDI